MTDNDPGAERADGDLRAAPSVPVRYRLAPLFGLVALGIVPVAALAGLLVWSDAVADEYEASESVQAETFEPSTEPTPALTTSVLDLRRAPADLARIGAGNQLADAFEQLAAFVDARSCLAVSIDGRAVSSWNGDVPVLPASTNKLLVGGVAIEVLGADFRFTTSAAAPAPVDGVIEGDLYLVGGGDPSLVASGAPLGDDVPAASTALDALADAVVGAGITSVRGAVVGDASRYDDEYVNPTWEGGVAYVDAGPIGGLVVNDGIVVGRSARQRDPGEAAAREFTRLLQDRGVSVSGGWQAGPLDPAVPVIASIESPPLATIVSDMLTRSDNDTAEMLVKEIGVATAQAGTRAAGLDGMFQSLETQGVPMTGVVLRDGSGLSTTNRVTCAAVLEVLQLGRGGPIDAGLPVAALSGTLANEFQDSDMVGRLRAKTGTLGNPPVEADPPAVKGLAGYVDPAAGPGPGTIEFVVIVNSPEINDPELYQPLWKALGERFATYPAGPSSDSLGPR